MSRVKGYLKQHLSPKPSDSVVQYLGELKVSLWDYKGIILPQKGKGYLLYN